jgi:hypothetical protein
MQERYADLSAHVKPFLGISAGVAASGYITYGVPVNGDTVVVNGTTFTKAAALGAAAFSTIAELCTLIDAMAGITATQNGTTITITYSTTGEAGNSVTLTRAGSGTLAVSGATLTGGVNGDTTKDTVLNLLLDMACNRLDQILGVSTLAKHTVTDELFDGGVSEVLTKDFPVLSVTSIKQGSTEDLWTQTHSYQLQKNRVGIEGTLAGGKGYERNKITYVAGYVTYMQNAGTSGNSGSTYSGQTITFPDNLLLATLILVGGLFNQKQSMGVTNYDIKGFRVSFRDELEAGQFKSIVSEYKKYFNAAI